MTDNVTKYVDINGTISFEPTKPRKFGYMGIPIEKSRMIKLHLAAECILSCEPAGHMRATTNFSRELYVVKEPKQLLSNQMHIVYQTRLLQGLLFMANLMEMLNQSGKVSMRSKKALAACLL